MAKSKRKTRTQTQTEYYKQRTRITRTIKRMEKQGFIFPEFDMPSVPKKITQASINRLKKLTPKYLREKYGYALNEETGEVKEAQIEFNLRRLQNAKQSPKTRERNKAERFNEQYFPTKTNIVINNYVDQAQSTVTARDYLEGLKDMITENIQDPAYLHRSSKSVRKSNKAVDTVRNLIDKIISNKQANQVAYNIMKNGGNNLIQDAINRMCFSAESNGPEIAEATSEIIALLTNNGKLSADDYYALADRSDEDGYNYD